MTFAATARPSAFDEALRSLQNDVLTMASLAGRNLSSAMRGLLERSPEAAEAAIDGDREVDAFENRIDESGLEIIDSLRPSGYALRRVAATMRVSSDLERISDHAVTIGRCAREIFQFPPLPLLQLVEPLYQSAQELLDSALQAFIEGDVRLALSLAEQDQQLDTHQMRVEARLRSSMIEIPQHIPPLLQLFVVARNLERIGDHAVNIAEASVFIESGTDIRHGGSMPQAASPPAPGHA